MRKLTFQALLTLTPLFGFGVGGLAAHHFAYRATFNAWERILATWMSAFGGLGIAVCLAAFMFWLLYKIDPRHAVDALRSLFFDTA